MEKDLGAYHEYGGQSSQDRHRRKRTILEGGRRNAGN
jgi:hypothetical protein